MDAHFATKSELFVVKKGSFGAKKELFGDNGYFKVIFMGF